MTQTTTTHKTTAAQAAAFLRSVSKEVPTAAVVLGSGVNVLENLTDEVSVPFKEVFGISPSVAGHSGAVSIGKVDGKLVAVLRGRFHIYEGHDWDTVTLPTRTIIEWGVPHLFLTNAAGGLNLNFDVGDLMLITGYRDHLNTKFKDSGLLSAVMAEATSCENQLTKTLWQTGERLAKENKEFRPLQNGVYAGLLGPNYETLAEIEMLRRLKADAVGMSTVPELQTALGSKTLAAALSVVTNVWKEDVAMEGHEEVLRAAKEASKRLDLLFRAAISS